MHKHNAAFLAALMCVTHGARAQSAPRLRVPVAARDLARGNVLSASDIAWADTSLATAGRTVVTPGWIARRAIRAGEVLREPSVSRPDLVASGNAVDVIYTVPGVTIKVRGTAVGNGAEGDEVFVKLENRKRLRGIVAGANTVRVM
ncbi:MAG TPA: flagellar basal body P-ring formation chaperone FlgA [Candidatus Elarobacter sp.]|nr:flagellar basal body P-ring formation chaperone FlgA [Candidatus Elarobacter sp.]